MTTVDEALRALGVGSAQDVMVGCSPAAGSSTDPNLAAERARELARNPRYYAKTRSKTPEGRPTKEVAIPENVYHALVKAGATNET